MTLTRASLERSIKHSGQLLEYTLKDHHLRRHINKGRARCDYQNCLKILKVGDRIVRRASPGKIRLFHKKCAQVLNIIMIVSGWGRPSFAKREHYFFSGQGSACEIYDSKEAPEHLQARPEDYSKICEGCLLVLAKEKPEELVRAKYGYL